ncbi:MAG: M28 family peptidase, partial [Chloroflexi bacterium]|nr:M28 family peptidase [Chloroflexota bacterium]
SLVERQVAFGPRIPGTDGSAQAAEWIGRSLEGSGWETSVSSSVYQGVELRNVIGRRGSSNAAGPIVIGTHYDTRPRADRDPLDPSAPVPGANDGASGVAVLLELARVLPADADDPLIWLAFFDGEDSGDLDGWEWSAGAAAFVAQLDAKPQAVVIVDMVGDSDLRLPRERSSDSILTDEIWGIARDLGADAFVDEPGIAILDDHRPFLALGIPAVLIIDLEYDYWHTTGDTQDKVSAESLEQVGSVLQAWILSRR